MRASDAVNALRDLADDTLFQPESPAVPIQIVGLLEAAGLPFDRLWIAGLAADRWPPAPQPQPLLPLKWQRDHDVPRSSAVRELRFARKTTTLLLRGAPRVVVSHARTTGDEPRRASQLIAELDLPQFAPISPQPRYAHAIHASAPSLDVTADHHAPPVLEGQRLRGGARIVEAQGNCPFQAVVAFRLNADQWPEPQIGLTQMERGTLVHAALAAFWRDVKTSAALAVLDESELDDRIASAVESARFELTQERWRSVPKVIATAETRRIAALLRMWIIAHDRVRPPFAVDAIETRIDLSLAGLTFQLKVDRIDRVGDDAIIIDYKTGGTTSPKGWFDVRPRAPQLGMYALAYAQSGHDAAVRAVAYGQVRSGALKVNGVAADAAAWPALIPVSTINPAIADWPAFEAWWQAHLTALAEELRDGVAYVAPRDGAKTCRTCGMAALCRIGAAAIGHDDGGND